MPELGDYQDETQVNKEILTTLPEEDPEGSLRESTSISLDRLNRAGIDRSRFDSSDPTQILLSWVDPAGNVGFWGASRGNRSLGGRSDPGSSDSGSIPAILPSMKWRLWVLCKIATNLEHLIMKSHFDQNAWGMPPR
ncbi:hypothetical protein Taro_033091 [Colocasia esculenta]|uniref:Uncharacterized protein n=1 Tax=Colocasia esculenta TaxID=4460 RepID=A0A843W0R8_COLES|nr:hypothetical protein [Colocasia esculenta]